MKTIFLLVFVTIFLGCENGEKQKKHEAAHKLLIQGALAGSLTAMEKALSNGANVNESWFTSMPLYWASGKCQTEAAKYLIENGADINHKNGVAKRTALHEASLRGCLETVKLLIDKNADINLRNSHNRTPLFYVTTPPPPLTKPENSQEIAEYLVSKGAIQ